MESASQNFDDGGPADVIELSRQTAEREAQGEIISEVLYNGQPIGAIGYCQGTPELGAFRGIVFAKSAHGTGVPFAAVAMVLEEAFKNGTSKVFARCFEDNVAIYKFLKKLGAVDEDIEAGYTTRGGEAVKWKVLSIGKYDFLQVRARDGQGINSFGAVPAARIPGFAR